MRKLLLALPILGALLLGSCRGDEGPMGPAGPAGEDGHIYFEQDIIHIMPDHWEIYDDGKKRYYKAEYDAPFINFDICDIGMVTAYNLLEDKGVEYQTQLPMTTYDYEGELDNESYKPYQKTLDYEFTQGHITFYCVYNDFYVDENDNPGEYHIRVICHY